MKRLAVLGSTGSIGTSTLDVVERFPERFAVVTLAAGRNLDLLAEQVRRHRPLLVAVADAADAVRLAERFPGLKGGDDRAVSEGHGPARVTVRLIGGEGNDLLDGSGAGRSRFYDSSGDNRVVEGPSTLSSDRPYRQPSDDRGMPSRDWGSQCQFLPWVRANGDYGLVLGGVFYRTRFGFRKHPYAQRHSVTAGYSTYPGSTYPGGATGDYDSRMFEMNLTRRF